MMKMMKKGSVRRNDGDDEKLVASIDAAFMSLDFSPSSFVMQGLPDTVSMEYLVSRSQHYKERCDAVERTFKKKLMDNSHSFMRGMQQIQDVKLDLLLTNNLCVRARRSLQNGDRDLVHGGFVVMATYQRRKRMVHSLRVLYDIQSLKEMEAEFHGALKAQRFLDAIGVHKEMTSLMFGKYEKVQCLELMRKRFGDGTRMITDALQRELLSLMYAAPTVDLLRLRVILESYHELDLFHLMNGLLEDECKTVLTVKCSQIVCRHIGYNEEFIASKYGLLSPERMEDPKYKNYRSLCAKLSVGQFMAAFMDVAGRVVDILHSYYKVESLLIKFRMNTKILSEDMNIVRKGLWMSTQNLLGALLECSQFSSSSKIKMADLLLALHGATIFKMIGQSFSGSESVKLSASIRSKCISYLSHFRSTFFESIKTNFDNEMWVVLPIPSNFGVHSIRELHRNRQWMHEHDEDEQNSNEHKKDHIPIYQKFLSGDNIFDELMANKLKADKEKKSKPSSIFDEDHAPMNTMNQMNHNHPNNNNMNHNQQTEPCITSTSLNLAKFIGKCLEMMECLEPVSYESFVALRDSFKFYLYHVFIWFGVNVHNFFETEKQSEFADLFGNKGAAKTKEQLQQLQQQKNIMAIAQKKYPMLTTVINTVNDELRERKLAPELEDLIKSKLGGHGRTQRPRRLPHYAKCYMQAFEALELYAAGTMQGVAARFVATETLTFLVNVIKSQHGRLINILGKKKKAELYTKSVSKFIAEIENVVVEFKKYMYRNVPTLLVHLGSADNKDSIISHINSTNWNIKSLTTEHNGYVDELIEIFSKIERVLSSHSTLPKFIHNRLNKEAIIYVEEQLVEVYADCRRCTTEGRALMSLDQSELKKSYPICKYEHSWEYTTNFIQAYYLPKDSLLEWIQQHPEYPLKAHKSFLRVGRASDGLKRKDRLHLEAEITAIYTKSRQKQQKEIRQKQKERLSKPNLDEINKINQINQITKPNLDKQIQNGQELQNGNGK